jgi:hypothetical protein
MRRALTFYTLGKPRLWREFAKERSLRQWGWYRMSTADLPFAWFSPGTEAPPMAFKGVDRLLFAKLTSQEVLWSALAFCCV